MRASNVEPLSASVELAGNALSLGKEVVHRIRGVPLTKHRVHQLGERVEGISCALSGLLPSPESPIGALPDHDALQRLYALLEECNVLAADIAAKSRTMPGKVSLVLQVNDNNRRICQLLERLDYAEQDLGLQLQRQQLQVRMSDQDELVELADLVKGVQLDAAQQNALTAQQLDDLIAQIRALEARMQQYTDSARAVATALSQFKTQRDQHSSPVGAGAAGRNPEVNIHIEVNINGITPQRTAIDTNVPTNVSTNVPSLPSSDQQSIREGNPA